MVGVGNVDVGVGRVAECDEAAEIDMEAVGVRVGISVCESVGSFDSVATTVWVSVGERRVELGVKLTVLLIEADGLVLFVSDSLSDLL